MNFQFTDGAEYRVAALAYVAGQPLLRTEKNVAVIAAEPPARAMIPAISFFVAIIALGLAVGRWSKRQACRLTVSSACFPNQGRGSVSGSR